MSLTSATSLISKRKLSFLQDEEGSCDVDEFFVDELLQGIVDLLRRQEEGMEFCDVVALVVGKELEDFLSRPNLPFFVFCFWSVSQTDVALPAVGGTCLAKIAE